MNRKSKGPAFLMRSGNTSTFKMMGSSPAKALLPTVEVKEKKSQYVMNAPGGKPTQAEITAAANNPSNPNSPESLGGYKYQLWKKGQVEATKEQAKAQALANAKKK